MKHIFFSVAACTAIAACSTTPTATPDSQAPVATAKPATTSSSTMNSSATTTPMSSQPSASMSESQRLARINALLANKSIYFDYDSFSIKPEYQAVLKNDFNELKTSPRLNIKLEGNADERGSSEYNLALGQKRADAVKQSLELLGLPDARVESVSFGKERPRATCHEEKCWAENRRVDLDGKK